MYLISLCLTLGFFNLGFWVYLTVVGVTNEFDEVRSRVRPQLEIFVLPTGLCLAVLFRLTAVESSTVIFIITHKTLVFLAIKPPTASYCHATAMRESGHRLPCFSCCDLL